MIYSKKIKAHAGWLKAFTEYESICGFEPMYQDDVDQGTMTFYQAWSRNIRWLVNVLADTTSIQIPDVSLEDIQEQADAK